MNLKTLDENNNEVSSFTKRESGDEEVIIVSEELIPSLNFYTQLCKFKFEILGELCQESVASSGLSARESGLSADGNSQGVFGQSLRFSETQVFARIESSKYKLKNWEALFDPVVDDNGPDFLQNIVLLMNGSQSKSILYRETLNRNLLKIKGSFERTEQGEFIYSLGISQRNEKNFKFLVSSQGTTQKDAKMSAHYQIFKKLLRRNISVKRIPVQTKTTRPEVNTFLSCIAELAVDSSLKLEPIPKDNIGYIMLCRLGWVQGTGLGKHGQGILEPVKVMLKASENRHGLGFDSGLTLRKACQFIRNYVQSHSKIPIVFPKDVGIENRRLIKRAYKQVSLELNLCGKYQSDIQDGHVIISRCFNFPDIFYEAKFVGQVIDEYQVVSMGVFSHASILVKEPTPGKSSKKSIYAENEKENLEISSCETSSSDDLCEPKESGNEAQDHVDDARAMKMSTWNDSIENQDMSTDSGVIIPRALQSDSENESYGDINALEKVSFPHLNHLTLISKENATFLQRIVILSAGNEKVTLKQSLKMNGFESRLQVQSTSNGRFLQTYEISKKDEPYFHILYSLESGFSIPAKGFLENQASRRLTETNIIVKRAEFELLDTELAWSQSEDSAYTPNYILKKSVNIMKEFMESDSRMLLVFPIAFTQLNQEILWKAFKSVSDKLNVEEKFQLKTLEKRFIFSRCVEFTDIFYEAKFVGQIIDEFQVISMGVFEY